MIRRLGSYVAIWAIGALVGSLAVPTYAAFKGTASNSGNRFVAAADWVAPQVAAAVIRKSTGGVGGYIKQGGPYFVFASVSDAGNPSSGISSVTADVSSVTSGQTSVSLSSGSWTVEGVAYNYRSAQLTAGAVLLAGTKSFAVRAEDAAANVRSATGFLVTVDNTMPTNTDIQTADGGGNLGTPEQGDKIFYTYDERLEPDSIVPGWTGSTINVGVEITNNANNDLVKIFDTSFSTQLPLGTLETNGNYVTATARFGPSGVPSTMVQSGGVFTVTLGTLNSGTVRSNVEDAILWLPSSSVYDLAGNNLSPVNLTEPGLLDPDF